MRKKAPAKKAKRSRAAVLPAEYNMLLTATLCLLAFGAVMVFSASSTTRVLSDGGLSDSAFYLKRTLMFGLVGLVVMHLVARHGLVLVRRLTPAILALSFFLLFAVLVAGTTVNGSSRWLGSGFLQIQPSELAKVALILYGADLLANKTKRELTLQAVMPFLLVAGLAAMLIVAEPDLGTTMVVAFAVAAMLVAAGVRVRDLALVGLVLAFFGLLMTLIEPYRMARLTAFLDPGADASGAGFQAAQAKIALGSGGLFGVGIGNGVQKLFYLPEAHTDMISAIIGEELGLVGIVGVVGLFSLFGYAGLRIAQRAKDRYGKLLVAGLTSLVLGAGDDQPLRRDGAGAADRRAAALHLIRQQQPADDPVRRRADPQRRPWRDRRRWQTAPRRGWTLPRAHQGKESIERCQKSQEWWWRRAEQPDTSCRPWQSPTSFGLAAPRCRSSVPASGSRRSWYRPSVTRSTSSRCVESTAATRCGRLRRESRRCLRCGWPDGRSVRAGLTW